MNGYVGVDCTGINLLAGEKQTVSGIFAKSKEAYDTDKPIIAFNMQYGAGVKLTPVSVMAIYEGGKYCFTSSVLQIWIDEEDGVEVVNLAPPNTTKTTKKTTTKED